MMAAETAAPVAAPSHQGRYAGFVSRGAAGAIDVVVCATLSTLLVFFSQAFVAVINAEPVGNTSVDPDIATVLIAALTLAYFTLSWAVTGRTIGEALMGLRVVRMNGTRVHLLRAFVRCIVGLFSFALFFLGYLWILVDNRRRAWQDLAARTVVVYDWDER